MELFNKKERKKGRKTDYGNEDVNLRPPVLGTSIRISSQRTAILGTGGAGVTGDRKPVTSGTREPGSLHCGALGRRRRRRQRRGRKKTRKTRRRLSSSRRKNRRRSITRRKLTVRAFHKVFCNL
jgi:hypothetical protein